MIHVFSFIRFHFVVFALATAFFTASQAAGSQTTSCTILIPSCPTNPTYIGTFLDTYNVANSNQAECMQRATDYYDWCGLKPQSGIAITTSYLINGVVAQSETVGKTACTININKCSKYPSAQGIFLDSDLAADASAATCNQRALDYYAWCGDTPYPPAGGFTAANPAMSVVSTFYQNGAVTSTQQIGSAVCMITQKTCPNHPTAVGTFADGMLSAYTNPKECMQRATDYYDWCGASTSQVSTADYYLNGQIEYEATTSASGTGIISGPAAPANSASNPFCPTSSNLSVNAFGAVADGVTDSTNAINTALACAVENATGATPVTVDFGAGTYFAACSQASNTHCLRVIGTGSTSGIRVSGVAGATKIIIGNPDTGGFLFYQVANVSLSNLSIDYSVLPFTQGTISAIGNGTFDFQVQPGMRAIPASLCAAYSQGQPNVDASPNHLGYFPGASFGLVMDPSNGQSILRNAGMTSLGLTPSSCAQVGTSVWRLGTDATTLAALSVGDNYVQLIGRSASKNTIWFNGSSDISVSNVQVYAGGNIAGLFTLNSGKIAVDRFQVRFSPGSGRFITTDADGIHMANNRAQPTITNSFFEGMADDGINIHANANYAYSVSAGGNVVELSGTQPVLAGDTVEIISQQNGQSRGMAVVQSVTTDPKVAGNLILTLNQNIPGIQASANGNTGDEVFNISGSGPGAIIENNTFGRHRGRDILEHSPGSVIAQNLFSDINWMAIQLDADLTWGEGPTARNVTIKDNQFYGSDLSFATQVSVAGAANSAGAVPPNGPTNISLSGNRFANAGGAWNLIISSANSVTVTNNQTVSSACSQSPNAGMLIQASTNVSVDDTQEVCGTLPAPVLGSIGVNQGGSLAGDHYFGSDGSGSIDTVSASGLVFGWGIDYTNSAESIPVGVYLDGPAGYGTYAGQVLASAPSPDLSWAAGSHRFTLQLPPGVHGWHTLYAYALRVNAAAAPISITPSGVLFFIP